MKKLMIAALGAVVLSGCSSLIEDVPMEEAFDMSVEKLQGHDYIVTKIDGVEVGEGLSATMNFHEDRVTGRGFCNTYSGVFEENLHGEIEVSNLLYTKRLCEEEKMQHEMRLDDLLSENMVFTPTATGYLATTDEGSFEITEIIVVEK